MGTRARFLGTLLIPCLLVSFVFLSGCAGRPAPTPTPTKTPRPSPAKANPAPATSTPLPTSTSTPPPQPSPSPTLAANICPLTGEPVSDPSVLQRRPLAVKISNFPAIVRPQAGLSFADVVFEHIAEANLTRFTAIYLCKDAPRVGAIRSARLIDLEIPAMFKSIFAFSGASGGVKQKILNSDFADRTLSPDPGFNDPGFYRIPAPGKAYEHTLFSDTKTLWEIATQRGVNTPQQLQRWAFSPEPPPGGTRAHSLRIVYHPKYIVTEYEYDPERGIYRRFVQGEPHTDELTGEQLTAANVVLIYANHVQTDILEDTLGHYSIEIQIWGEGTAIVFRDGLAFQGKWVRPKREDLIRFVDMAGKEIPLKPGNTWIQVVPLGFDGVTVK